MRTDRPDDDALDEMLARSYAAIREAAPGQREAVLRGLGELGASAVGPVSTVREQGRLPWWRRSISIPLPLAAALAVLMAVALVSSFRNWQRPVSPIGVPVQGVKDAGAENRHAAALAQVEAPARPTWTQYETEMYLCGVGRLNSETYYVFKE